MPAPFPARFGRTRRLFGLLALSALLPLVARAQPVQEVKIGHAAPLSGGMAHWGKDNENGVRLAIEEINATKPVIGGQPVHFELLSEDDQGDPRQAVTVAHKLVDAGIVAMLGHFNSGAAIPASAIYAKAGIADLSSATNPGFTEQGLNTVFRIVASDADVGAVLAKMTVQQLKARRIALIDDRTAYGKGAADGFAERVTALGAQVVAHEYGSDRTVDFSAILTGLRAKNPDVIFYGGVDAQGGLLARQMKQLGLTAKLVGSDGLCTAEIVRISQGAVNDRLYCSRGGEDLLQRPKGADFAQRYRARFKSDVLTYGPFLYDGMELIFAAMKAAGSTQPAQYLPALRSIRYEGVTNTFSFDDRGNLKNPGVTTYRYHNGQPVQIPGP